MSEERLKEIKDSIDFQLSVCDIPEYETSKLLAEEELELYNEVVRLKEIIDNAIKLCEENAEAILEYEGAYSEMFEEIRDALQGKEKEDDK